MIILIHGEDIEKSSSFLHSLIGQHAGWRVLRHDLKTEEVDLINLFLTDTLFSENKLIVLENFFKSKMKIDLKNLPRNQAFKIVIFENEQLSQTRLATLPTGTKVFLFKPEPVIFQFFDQLYPGNQQTVFQLFAKIKDKFDSFLFFTMFIRHLRHLLIFSNNYQAKSNLQDWQVKKYKKLAAKFSQAKLRAAYRALLKIDIKIKTGEITNPFVPLSLLLLELTKS